MIPRRSSIVPNETNTEHQNFLSSRPIAGYPSPDLVMNSLGRERSIQHRHSQTVSQFIVKLGSCFEVRKCRHVRLSFKGDTGIHSHYEGLLRTWEKSKKLE